MTNPLQSKIPGFFAVRSGPGTAVGRATLAKCSRAPAEFHYLHAPRWNTQAKMLPYYMQSLTPGTKPVVMSSVGYWEGAAEVPLTYLAALAALRARHVPEMIALLG